VIEPLLLASTGLGIGLLVSALLLGMRHGVDWDHIAAITDLAATQDTPRRGLFLGTIYALGHGIVVLVIGAVAIVVGRSLPESIDSLFGRIVGWTLIVLGVYVAYSLIAHRDGFRMQSRWMLVIRGVRRLVARFRSHGAVEHEHRHAAFDVHHETGEFSERGGLEDALVHSHSHVHAPDDLVDEYGGRVSFGIGMLHGVGAETPTQVVIFLAAAQAGGSGAGLAVLVAFLLGLFATNTLIAVASSYGFRSSQQRLRFQLVLGSVTAVVSIVVGVLFATGREAVLPAFLGG
jgi:high-affinity nickel-transport protein